TTEALADALAHLDADGRLTDGTVRTSSIGARPSVVAPHLLRIPVRRHWRWAFGGAAVAAVAVAMFFWREIRPPPSRIPQAADLAAPAATTGKFMAVLPFTVTDAAIAHVATGIGEALSAKLFQLKDVRLASGSAVERAAGLGSPENIG